MELVKRIGYLFLKDNREKAYRNAMFCKDKELREKAIGLMLEKMPGEALMCGKREDDKDLIERAGFKLIETNPGEHTWQGRMQTILNYRDRLHGNLLK